MAHLLVDGPVDGEFVRTAVPDLIAQVNWTSFPIYASVSENVLISVVDNSALSAFYGEVPLFAFSSRIGSCDTTFSMAMFGISSVLVCSALSNTDTLHVPSGGKRPNPIHVLSTHPGLYPL